jgi:hypothetical protein
MRFLGEEMIRGDFAWRMRICTNLEGRWKSVWGICAVGATVWGMRTELTAFANKAISCFFFFRYSCTKYVLISPNRVCTRVNHIFRARLPSDHLRANHG